MIQELLGASSGFVAGERKISLVAPGVVLPPPTPSPSLPSSATTATTTTTTTTSTVAAATATTTSNSENQNLRCPRCDSSNTKFCYYNNYNLTQPRHFCKTCRRYWTKGGALRNVPIGGGCRKNKNIGVSSSSVAVKTSATVAKMKTAASELGSRLGLGGGGYDQEPPASSILWGSPQNSHLLGLLRASQNQNPNPSPSLGPITSNAVTAKEEGNLMGSHMVGEPMGSNGLLGGHRSPGFDPSLGLIGSFWRSTQDQPQQQNSGFALGEQQNSGIQELYQRLRSSSSSASYCSDESPLFLSNMASSSSSSSSSSLAILESAPVSGGGIGLGYWNQPLSWSDLPTTNGASAYP